MDDHVIRKSGQYKFFGFCEFFQRRTIALEWVAFVAILLMVSLVEVVLLEKNINCLRGASFNTTRLSGLHAL